MLEIKGVFDMDDNFTYVFTEDTVMPDRNGAAVELDRPRRPVTF